MPNRLLIALSFAVLLMPICRSIERVPGTFTFPHSVLLFGRSAPGMAKEELLIVSTTGIHVVQAPVGFWGQGFNSLPALSPRADRIAWSLAPLDAAQGRALTSVLGVYSLEGKSWKTYGEFCRDGIGSKVFSPDGTKVAFASKAGPSLGESRCFDNPMVLQILDIATGRFTPVPNSGKVSENARLDWSPDGKYLVEEVCCSSSSSQINVIDLASGNGRVIAEGTDPSWSPQGDWIAYQDEKKQRCVLIHPDGTGVRIIRDLRKSSRFGHWMFFKGALWSPDGRTLLFDEQKVDSGGRVTKFDLPSGEVTELSKNGPIVLGWALRSGD